MWPTTTNYSILSITPANAMENNQHNRRHFFHLPAHFSFSFLLSYAFTSSLVISFALSCEDTSSIALFNWAILSAKFCLVTSGSSSSSSRNRGRRRRWSSPKRASEIWGANTKPRTPQMTPPRTNPDQKLPPSRSALTMRVERLLWWERERRDGMAAFRGGRRGVPRSVDNLQV